MSQSAEAASAGRNQTLAERSFARRWWFPAVTLVVGSLLIAGVFLYPSFEPGHRTIAKFAAVALTWNVLTGWFFFFSHFAQRTRMLCLAGELIVIAYFVINYRIESFDGEVNPKIVSRWAPKKDTLLKVEQPAGSRAATETNRDVDLTQKSDHDFSQFLGENRRGIIEGLHLARDWSKTPPRLIWRQPIGAGWSAFSVVGDFACTQEQRSDQELVTCYELKTGKLRWLHGDTQRYDSVLAGDGPRGTPTIAGGRVYTLGPTGHLLCLDGSSGKVLWSHNISTEHHAADPDWGRSCSPLVIDNLVIVSAGGPDGHSLVAYRQDSGDLAWQAGSDLSSYSSPIEATLSNVRQILIVNENSLASHDPQTGRLLWQHSWPGKEKIAQPVVLDDSHIFLSAGYGLGCQLLEITRDDKEEWKPKKLWDSKQLKTKFTNVVVRDDHVFGLDEGVLTCLDLKTGKRHWRGGRYGHGQVLLVDDLLLLQAESGEIVLIEANWEKFVELTKFPALAEQTWNNPALAGRYLLVRNNQEAACYELPVQEK
jgi:outer membrane protein assembly factor BamB